MVLCRDPKAIPLESEPPAHDGAVVLNGEACGPRAMDSRLIGAEYKDWNSHQQFSASILVMKKWMPASHASIQFSENPLDGRTVSPTL